MLSLFCSKGIKPDLFEYVPYLYKIWCLFCNSVQTCACLFHSRTAIQKDGYLDRFELCTKAKVNKCIYTSSDLNCSVKIWAFFFFFF